MDLEERESGERQGTPDFQARSLGANRLAVLITAAAAHFAIVCEFGFVPSQAQKPNRRQSSAGGTRCGSILQAEPGKDSNGEENATAATLSGLWPAFPRSHLTAR
jgi:hypothetical protein